MARLVVRSGSERGREFVLKSDQTLGRAEDNDIVLSDTRLSRRNTRIFRDGSTWKVEDLQSKNGTFVDGEKVEAKTLDDSSEIRIGETYFVFLTEEEVAVEAAPNRPAPPPTDDDDPLSLASNNSSGARRKTTKVISNEALTFSTRRREINTQTSLTWLRQDLAQRDVSFRILLLIGVLCLAAGLFWLTQFIIAG